MWRNVYLQAGFDVFNALDLMENKSFLEELKFGIGDGNLQYYLFNWRCPSMKPEQVIIMLKLKALFYALLFNMLKKLYESFIHY